jgi:hypothetical protein
VGLFSRRPGRGDPLLPGFARERAFTSRWSITASIGGFSDIVIAWDAGDTIEEAIETFLAFIEDDDDVERLSPIDTPRSSWRRLHVVFQGQHKEIVFVAQWVSSFTIERG